MVRLEYSWRLADDLASVASEEVEAHVMRCLDALESFPEIGSPLVPDRIERVRSWRARNFRYSL